MYMPLYILVLNLKQWIIIAPIAKLFFPMSYEAI